MDAHRKLRHLGSTVSGSFVSFLFLFKAWKARDDHAAYGSLAVIALLMVYLAFNILLLFVALCRPSNLDGILDIALLKLFLSLHVAFQAVSLLPVNVSPAFMQCFVLFLSHYQQMPFQHTVVLSGTTVGQALFWELGRLLGGYACPVGNAACLLGSWFCVLTMMAINLVVLLKACSFKVTPETRFPFESMGINWVRTVFKAIGSREIFQSWDHCSGSVLMLSACLPTYCFLLARCCLASVRMGSLGITDVFLAIASSFLLGSYASSITQRKLNTAHSIILDLLPRHCVDSLLSANREHFRTMFTPTKYAVNDTSRARLSPHACLPVDALRTGVEPRKAETPSMEPVQCAGLSIGPLDPAATTCAERHDNVTVMFCDIVNFTQWSTKAMPQCVMQLLNDLYTRLDLLIETRNVYKVETIGDCYMAATGLLHDDPYHASTMVEFATAVLEEASRMTMPETHERLQLRVGIHTGPVMAGMIGRIRRQYRLFGDTVNTASRMETASLPGCILVSAATYEQICEFTVHSWQRQELEGVKGKGDMVAYIYQPHALQQQCMEANFAAIPPVDKCADQDRLSTCCRYSNKRCTAESLTVDGCSMIAASHFP